MVVSRRAVVVHCVLLALGCPVLLVSAQPLANPGFETGKGADIAGWSVPTYWQGELAATAAAGDVHSGRRAAVLRPAEKGGEWSGRMLGTPLLPVRLGEPQRFSVWAKGRGALRLGLIRYRPPQAGEVHYAYLWPPEPTVLGHEWRCVSLDYTIREPEFQRTAFCIEVQGQDAVAFLDDVEVRSLVPDGVTLTMAPSHPMLAAGGACDLRLELRGTEPSGVLRVLAFPPSGAPLQEETAIDAEGGATFALRPGAEATGLWRLAAAHLATGATAEVHADVLAPARFAAFEQAAATLRIPAGRLHLLVIGDSLSDFNRGSNYVDKLAFWLERRGGTRCTVRNVGVGGDDIVRVWNRLNRVPGTHRQGMYDSIFEPLPTHIIVFLGHNDSKAKSSAGYAEHAVSPEVFETSYRQTLAKLGAETGAALIVLSSTSSVYEVTLATAERNQAAGKPHNLFGRPEHLERFNAIARRVAADCGAAFVDVYGPTRDHPDKASLFTGDGVHLSAEGHRFLALLLLERLFQ